MNPRHRNPNEEYRRPIILTMTQLPPPVHGAALKNQRMIRGGLADFFDFRVLRMEFATDIADIGRIRLGKLWKAFVLWGRELSWLVRIRPIALYINFAAHRPTIYRDAIYALTMRIFGAPYALHFPSVGLQGSHANAGVIGRFLIRSAIFGAKHLICISAEGCQDLRIRGSAAEDKIRLVLNGIPDESRGAYERKSEPDRKGPYRLLFLSNMIREKGTIESLSAVQRLRLGGHDVKAVFAGPFPSVEDKVEFVEEIRSRHLEGHVELWGAVAGERKHRALAAADLFLYPSYYVAENTPNVIIEAMQYGLAIVATRHAGIPTLVQNEETALLVNVRNVDELTTALERLIRDPDLRARLGSAGRLAYEQKHTMATWERALKGVFQELLNSDTIGARHRIAN